MCRVGWLDPDKCMIGLLRLGLQCCHCHLQSCPLQTSYQLSWTCSCRLMWPLWLYKKEACWHCCCCAIGGFCTHYRSWSQRTPLPFLWLCYGWQFACPLGSYRRVDQRRMHHHHGGNGHVYRAGAHRCDSIQPIQFTMVTSGEVRLPKVFLAKTFGSIAHIQVVCDD